MSAERPDALTDADTEALPSAGARLAPYLYPALTLAGLVVAWEAFTKLTAVSRLLLPAPSDIAATLVSALPLLVHMSAITAAEFLLGFGLSVVVGIPLGALLVHARPVELAVYPLLVASQMLWVMKSTVFRASSHSRWRSSTIWSRVRASRAPKGSSMRRSGGSWTSARQSATRWRMPPESSPG